MIEHWVEFIELNTNVMTCQESHEHTWSFNDQIQYPTEFMDFIVRSYDELNCLSCSQNSIWREMIRPRDKVVPTGSFLLTVQK